METASPSPAPVDPGPVRVALRRALLLALRRLRVLRSMGAR